MVKVHDKRNRVTRAGVKAIGRMIARRVDVGEVFSSGAVVSYLARMSGGSVRDVMRLVAYAANSARADAKPKINRAAANEAVQDMRLDYERLFIPGQVYYPVLLKIHQTKRDWFADIDQLSPERLEVCQLLFRNLLFSGAVLEYNGRENWYDVHPVIREIEAFREAQGDEQT